MKINAIGFYQYYLCLPIFLGLGISFLQLDELEVTVSLAGVKMFKGYQIIVEGETSRSVQGHFSTHSQLCKIYIR